jgi:hypothetical protein
MLGSFPGAWVPSVLATECASRLSVVKDKKQIPVFLGRRRPGRQGLIAAGNERVSRPLEDAGSSGSRISGSLAERAAGLKTSFTRKSWGYEDKVQRMKKLAGTSATGPIRKVKRSRRGSRAVQADLLTDMVANSRPPGKGAGSAKAVSGIWATTLPPRPGRAPSAMTAAWYRLR